MAGHSSSIFSLNSAALAINLFDVVVSRMLVTIDAIAENKTDCSGETMENLEDDLLATTTTAVA